MESCEAAGIQYLSPINPTPYLSHFTPMQNNKPYNHFDRFLTPYPTSTLQIPHLFHDPTPHMSSSCNNSTSDEDHQLSVIDERKQRRMISNRESARRSRMRKQKQLDELWLQVVRLRTENRELIDKLNGVLERHELILQENNQLREEATSLHQTLQGLQVNNAFGVLNDTEEAPTKSR
ncbi:hypothetical protein AAC387_Pa05g1430 [Persea americana]